MKFMNINLAMCIKRLLHSCAHVDAETINLAQISRNLRNVKKWMHTKPPNMFNTNETHLETECIYQIFSPTQDIYVRVLHWSGHHFKSFEFWWSKKISLKEVYVTWKCGTYLTWMQMWDISTKIIEGLTASPSIHDRLLPNVGVFHKYGYFNKTTSLCVTPNIIVWALKLIKDLFSDFWDCFMVEVCTKLWIAFKGLVKRDMGHLIRLRVSIHV